MTHVSNFAQYLDKRKLCLCVFNRASYGRCKSLIQELAKYENVELTVTLSSALLMEEFGNAAAEYITGDTENVTFELIDIGYTDHTHLGMCGASARILSRFSEYFDKKRFDCVVVVADRFETLPCAMAASYQNIPVAHVQGGEVTGNIDEKVRHAVTKIADYHFASTELAKDYILHMGEERSRIHMTGCPSIDLISKSYIARWQPKERYILSIFHPETENPDEAFEQTRVALEAVLEYTSKYGFRCYWFYPNPDPGRSEIVKLLDKALSENPAFIVKAINKEPEAFLRQLAGARMIVGNSSCGLRESSYLGVPAVNIGRRQNLRERADNVIDVDYQKEEILQAMEVQHIQRKYQKSRLFGSGRAGRYIAEWLAAKIDFSLKGPLTYPRSDKFRERHIGKGRTVVQKAGRSKPQEQFEAPRA